MTGPDGKPSFTFGQLTKGQKLMKVIPADVATAAANKWTVAGTSVPKVDGRAFVTGRAPVRVGHPPQGDAVRQGAAAAGVRGEARVASTRRPRRRNPGVTVVHDGDFVGVVGPTEHAAAKGLDAIKAEWKDAPKQVGAKELFKHLKDSRRARRGRASAAVAAAAQGRSTPG